MKKVLKVLAFLCFALVVTAEIECERGIANEYCTDPKLTWTEHHDGKCYKARCKDGMEICKEVDCEGIVSRSFEDDDDVPDATIEVEKPKVKEEL